MKSPLRVAERALRSVPSRAGFTLAEVAVTIVIVGIGLVMVLQGLNTAKISAANTRNTKLARELALLTLGQVESGLFQDDIENGLNGTYAEEGYPEFSYEVAVGDTSFVEKDPNGGFDNWAPKDTDTKKKDDDTAEEPYEKVKIRITFPKINVFTNELVLERWMPWNQVYGESATTDSTKPGATKSSGSTSTASASSGSGSAKK
jgi:prepilin-type N-terminal cleavage/methylation domain-containing protein